MNPVEVTAAGDANWVYIWVSYGLTWAFLAGYALSLWVRRPSAPEEDE